MIPLRDSIPSNSTPVVTILIILVNAAIFLYSVSLEPFSRNYFVASYGMTPDHFHVETMFTSMFLHGGWMHIIGNMWFLWIYGDNIEDILGKVKYLVFYLLCGAAAAFVHLVFNMDSRVPTIGASGAIAGVMGAYMVKFPHSRIVTLIPIIIFFTTVEIPAFVILIYWFVIQIFSGVGELGQAHINQGGVAWFAHIGGFLTGIILIYALRPSEPYKHRRDLQW